MYRNWIVLTASLVRFSLSATWHSFSIESSWTLSSSGDSEAAPEGGDQGRPSNAMCSAKRKLSGVSSFVGMEQSDDQMQRARAAGLARVASRAALAVAESTKEASTRKVWRARVALKARHARRAVLLWGGERYERISIRSSLGREVSVCFVGDDALSGRVGATFNQTFVVVAADLAMVLVSDIVAEVWYTVAVIIMSDVPVYWV